MKTSKSALIALGAALAMAFSLPAASAETEDTVKDDASTRTCFWLSQINDFRGLDNKHVWVKGVGQNRQYLLTLFSSCTGLPFAETIALSTKPTQRLCNNANEHLILVDQGIGNRSCLITTVEPVESLKAARALAAERKEEKNQENDDQN